VKFAARVPGLTPVKAVEHLHKVYCDFEGVEEAGYARDIDNGLGEQVARAFRSMIAPVPSAA
jgi:hypothetical protein